MKSLNKILINSRGFSLVELMVTVGIIGILASVAVPNYQKYQAKAKTVEAKIQLSKLYSAESYAQINYSTYVSCLNYTGYNPVNTFETRYYAVGFKTINATIDSDAVSRGMNSACRTTSAYPKYFASATIPQTGAVDNNIVLFFAAKTARKVSQSALETMQYNGIGKGNTAVSTNSYIAAAAGDISSEVNADVWTITQTKKLTHVQLGY